MALPLSRDTTYIAGSSPVSSNNLNNLQDMIIGAKQGSVVHMFGPGQMAWEPNWALNASGFLTTDAANEEIWLTFGAPVGTKVTAITVYLLDHVNDQIQVALYKVDMVAGTTAIKSTTVASDNSGTKQALAVTNIVQEVLAATEYWQVKILNLSTGVGGSTVYGVAVTFQVE